MLSAAKNPLGSASVGGLMLRGVYPERSVGLSMTILPFTFYEAVSIAVSFSRSRWAPPPPPPNPICWWWWWPVLRGRPAPRDRVPPVPGYIGSGTGGTPRRGAG